MIETTTAFTISLFLMVLGLVLGMLVGCENTTTRLHPKNFIKDPYCETAKIQEQEYKRCWKVEEVK